MIFLNFVSLVLTICKHFTQLTSTSINGEKTKRHPLTKIITDVVYKEKNRGGNVNKMTVYIKMFTAFGSEQSVSAA